jgi:hypothetical protein
MNKRETSPRLPLREKNDRESGRARKTPLMAAPRAHPRDPSEVLEVKLKR